MLTFHVVREGHGWGIHMDGRMTTHFRRQDAAVCQAHSLAAAIRRHGVLVAVTVESAQLTAQPAPLGADVYMASTQHRGISAAQGVR
jgi:glycine cleavage system pyridoxal-binding protein P